MCATSRSAARTGGGSATADGPGSSSAIAVGRSGRPSVTIAAMAISTPNTVNGVHESTLVRAIAAIAGPTSVAAPSSQPSATFAAASSRGPRTYAGSSVATTGRVVVTAHVEMTAPAYASTCGASVASATAIANIAADCTTRPVVRTRRAPRRSDQPPTNAANERRREELRDEDGGGLAHAAEAERDRGHRDPHAELRGAERAERPRVAVPHPAHESF